MTDTTDTGYAPKRWEFDAEVTRVFDNMLVRSIPDYPRMRELTFNLGARFVRDGTNVCDLGCSRGEALKPFIERFGNADPAVTFSALEVSEPMLEAARHNIGGSANVSVVRHDLRGPLPATYTANSSLILSVLTLQFVPIEYRQRIVREVFHALVPGGAFLLVEKVLGEDSRIDDVLVSTYYGEKNKNGYSEEDIMKKRLALEGVLVPLTARWNEEMLRASGFETVDVFWRSLNFAGWIAVKNDRAETE